MLRLTVIVLFQVNTFSWPFVFEHKKDRRSKSRQISAKRVWDEFLRELLTTLDHSTSISERDFSVSVRGSQKFKLLFGLLQLIYFLHCKVNKWNGIRRRLILATQITLIKISDWLGELMPLGFNKSQRHLLPINKLIEKET